MVRILEEYRPESFADRLLRGLGQAGRQLPESLGQYAQYQDKKAKETAGRLKGLPRSMDAYLKKFRPSLLENENKYNQLSDLAGKYAEQGIGHEQAVRLALEDLAGSDKEFSTITSKSGRGPEEGGILGGALGRYLKPAGEAIKKKPSLLATEAPVAALKSSENLANIHDPITAALKMAFGKGKEPTASGIAAKKLRENLDPELHEGAERVSDIGSILLDLLTPLPGVKSASKLAKPAEKVAQQVLEKVPGIKPGIKQIGKGKASLGPIKGATQSRIERVSPESKLFKPNEQAKIRQEQLKLHPKYAEEIAADVAERSARMEAKVPKTPIGEAGVAKRMELAQAELPKAQEMYQRAISRVRGIESELAKGVLPKDQASLEHIYKDAVKELNDAEFYLKTALNNARTGEARVGFDQMRHAARNKMIKIGQDVSEGREPTLSLRDYNPELVRKAKALDRKKPIPATRHEDYFTKVHEGYANEYRQRLANIEQEIKKLGENASLSSFQNNLQLRREKEALQKLIDHVEAENSIHRHKLALREVEQRRVAKERLGKFTRQAGEEKVKRLAKEAIQSPEKAAEAAEQSFSQAAQQAGNESTRTKILAEKEPVKVKMQEISQKKGSLIDAIDEASKKSTTSKEAAKNSLKLVKDMKQVFDSLTGKGPSFFKTRIGQDLLLGMGTEFASEVFKEFDIPISHSAAFAAILGRPGRGSIYRALIASLTRTLINKHKKNRYKDAISRGDDELLMELRKKYPPRIIKEAKEELSKKYINP